MKTMKFLTAGLLMFGASAIYAQDKVDNSMDRSPSFGVKGGINFARLSGDDAPGSSSTRANFHAGLVGEMPLADIFSIQAEALYSGQGYKVDNVFGTTTDLEYQLDYINVPILAKVYITKGLSVEAGPQFSFLVNEEYDFNADADEGDFDTTDANTFDFGVAAGLTFQTEFGLFATGRYTYGMTDVIDDTDLRNSVFQVSLGYKF